MSDASIPSESATEPETPAVPVAGPAEPPTAPSAGPSAPEAHQTAPPEPASAPVSRPTEQKYCSGCGVLIHKEARQCPHCGAPQADAVAAAAGKKSRVAAILLALFLGGLGLHKFYLGQPGMGILYLLFCWTFIPAVVALIEAIIYLTMSDADFAKKYG